MNSVQHLKDYQVVEFRRYTVRHGERARFVQYFDSYFPEAFEQLGAMVFGQFTERGNPDHFTWLRGFKDIQARPIVNAAFYYGPLWREHRAKVNAILPDSDDVMLLRPLHAEHGISVLPAVDPVDEPDGARGIVVAQVFAVKKGSEDAFAQRAGAAFARYRGTGVRPAGVLVTLDVPNNFPQLPIREDGPWLVWLGVVRDRAMLHGGFAAAMDTVEQSLAASGLLRGAPERVLMDPTPRSRLRWLDGVATP
ncbi:MAG: NIPSNAP family protein [Mizugakiibacter sp.]|uniref:NIPSNAP family protein n=1 Tax=Mizugakiibacter sp. TaxID=1972610 RepID=UPI0031C60C16|nr:NIPSNAP family protein [Xanthomonadaceae bacterium]